MTVSSIRANSTVSLVIDGTSVEMTWHELTALLATNACDGDSCASDVASASSVDSLWLLFGGCMVLLMILGFALLEVGCVHVKNTKHILFRNMMDLCMTGMTFYAVGYSFAFLDGNAFIGTTGFFLQGDAFATSDELHFEGHQYGDWFFQWAITAVCVTIFSGAVAERITWQAYALYSSLVGAFIYPIAAHWIWSATGWASVTNGERLFGVGAIDFAGCAVIHMIGGASALVGCILVGPRTGRFRANGSHDELPKQSVLYQSMGTLILWFGWYGFNCVSTLTLRGNMPDVMAKVAVNLTLAACAGGLTTVLIDKRFGAKIWDPCMVNNGILAGCVSITGSCSVIEPECAVALGVLASFVYISLSRLLVRWQIDDVVDAIPVHLGCGTLGALAPGIFASRKGMSMMYDSHSCGILYRCDGHSGHQLAAQVVYVLAVFAWIVAFCSVLFGGLKAVGLLRVSAAAEASGLDVAEHGGSAYHTDHDAPRHQQRYYKVDSIASLRVDPDAIALSPP
ncbi:hypothetical protein SDRG_12576 [Saprolegnia diclina VS20]|uniref:Ammonium transporter n=1 Tax=Saprolegnia diclina (strain VS20) TaxID=1156394 RepID=T0RIB7_SAPDV|nr:hypothetical protein SDRG_12576 [Saprolegnia diclina VS20]EQC29567.1 hypothetical protein SDRG_12576 [Saprolegnia diclina VS20]|eukprot:XP_008616871.1 hypothetical protein SDRG_12576 [Saprolegnia diclina VS20]